MSRRIVGPGSKDSAHYRRAMEAQERAHEQAVREHLSQSPRQRMEQAMRVARDVRVLERWGREHDRPWKLHERARELGIPER
jgi:hypothetical protein